MEGKDSACSAELVKDCRKARLRKLRGKIITNRIKKKKTTHNKHLFKMKKCVQTFRGEALAPVVWLWVWSIVF